MELDVDNQRQARTGHVESSDNGPDVSDSMIVKLGTPKCVSKVIWIELCLPQNSHVEVLTHNAAVFGHGAF